MSSRKTWLRVSFADDCKGGDDEDLGDICSICGEVYSDCPCPGPTQDGMEYMEVGDILFARLNDQHRREDA